MFISILVSRCKGGLSMLYILLFLNMLYPGNMFFTIAEVIALNREIKRQEKRDK